MWGVNLPVSEVHGMPQEKIQSIGCPAEGIVSVDEELAMYTDENEKETVKEALGHLREAGLVEVLIVIGLYAMLARLMKGLRVDDDPEIPGPKGLIGGAITATR
ncbi:uncharacterized protein KD926_002199 [Aspergillus affinis]|uniref:uncharacterized protein n=1 Tax=Aspergillus affinis TaxID=1070780 RepID=UPI0022FE830F|nr:uncharacterized protein KD926_002199 [Aspergillus affinis]KAI9036169.1 hypothetical protein KD926_002199 [Aspergillus affinis]